MKVVSPYRLSWRALAGAVLVGLVTANCTDTAGPDTASQGRIAIVPVFESSAAGIVAVDQVGIALLRSDSSTVALDTVIQLEPGQDSVDLTVTVTVLRQSEQFFLEITLLDAASDTVFRGGPMLVTASTSGRGEPVLIPLVYTGVGADAAGVRITTTNATAFFGDSVEFVAEAFDGGGVAIPGTPVRWHTTDETIASFPDHRAAWAHGGSARGSVPVVATLLNGPTDTSSVLVQPVPIEIAVSAGDGQTAPVGSVLPTPIEILVTAADLLGVEGVLVVFGVAGGNGTLSVDSVVTDGFGKAQAVWTLGATPGNLQATAVVPAIADTAFVSATGTVAAVSWINPAGGNWSNAANWNPAIVPGFGNQALIDLDGTYTVTLDVTTQVSVLTVGAATGTQTLSIATNILTVDAPSSIGVNGVLDLSGGTLNGIGTLSVFGSMLWSGGTMSDGGTLRVETGGLLTLGGGTKTLLGGRRIDNVGNVTWLAGDINAGEASSIINEPGATMGIQGDVQLLQGPGAPSAFFNGGMVTRSTGTGTVSINVIFDNNGAVDVLSGLLDLAGGGFGTGSFDVSIGATLHFEGNHDFGSIVNNGVVDVGAGIARLTGAFTHSAGATLSGFGEFKVDGDIITTGTIAMPAGELAVGGTLNSTGAFSVGTVTFFGTAQTIPVSLAYQNIQVLGTAAIDGTLSMSGFIVVFGFGDLTISSVADVSTSSDVIVTDDATLNVTGGGQLTVGNDLIAQMNAGVYIGLASTINVAKRFVTQDQAYLNMGIGVVLDVDGDVEFGGGSTAGMLPDGVIFVGGNFTQLGDPSSFAASGVHQVIFDGLSPQTITFTDFTNSFFQNLSGAGFADIVIASEIEVTGNMSVTSPGSVLGSGMEINVRGNFDIGIGATLSLFELEIDGILNASNVSLYDVFETDFHGTGQTIPTDLPYNDLTVSGEAAFMNAGSGSIAGNILISDFGILTMNQASMTVMGNFSTTQNGVLVMNDPFDVLTVMGNVDFGGDNTNALLDDGTLYVGGNFTQSALASPESFHPGGNHTVVFNGTGPQNVMFATPGIGIAAMLSHFANVAFENTGSGVILMSDVFAHSNLISSTGPASTVFGNGYRLAVGGLDVNDLVLDHVLLEWNGTPTFPSFGSFIGFNNVTFQGAYATNDRQFTVIHPGAAAPFAFTGLNFTFAPTLPGMYIYASDSDSAAPFLTINVTASIPATSGGLAVSAGGAVISW
ncbi:MAG: hypothetical protein O7I93_04315 [Gemmatimonadetes bacterium]|nr:hypothetical protein [Gemmatimonadota bacterium]